jgi:hypothetical protein
MTDSVAEQADRERARRDAQQRDEALKAQRDAEARTEEYMGADEFVVVAPYVTLKMQDPNGGPLVVRGFNEGAVVKSDDVDEENLRHHVETRLVLPKDSAEARFAGPAGTPKPGEPPNVPVTEQPVAGLPLDERQRRQQAAAAEAEKQQAKPSRPSPKG